MNDNGIAISDILDMHQALTVHPNADKHGSGLAFALDVLRLIERNKDLHLSLGSFSFITDPHQVEVNDNVISIAGIDIDVPKIGGGTDGEYTFPMIGIDGDQVVPLRLRAA